MVENPEPETDYAKSLYDLAFGYFVLGPIVMFALVGIVGLIAWLS